MSVRASFVARFGEADAAAIETASAGHCDSIHKKDNHGSDPFKYAFLNCIAHECVGRYRKDHGINATQGDMRDWALAEGDLGSHDGDIPDYLAMLAGAYGPWLKEAEAAS